MKKTIQDLQTKNQIKLMKEDIRLLKKINNILIDMAKIDNNIIETQKQHIKTDNIIILLLIISLGLITLLYSGIL